MKTIETSSAQEIAEYLQYLYNIARDKLFLVPTTAEPRSTITIRYEKPKNNQTNGIHYEEEYLIENILCVETLHGTPKGNYGEDKVQTTM